MVQQTVMQVSGKSLQDMRGEPGDVPQSFFYAGISAVLALVFLGDVFTPLGVAIWVYYLVPVAITLFVGKPWLAPAVSAAVSLMMVIGFLLSEPGLRPEIAVMNRIFGITTVWLMGITGYFFIRNKVLVRHQRWLQQARTRLAEAVTGEQRLEQLGDNILRELVRAVKADAGVMYALSGAQYVRVSTYGVPATSVAPYIGFSDGLLGQAVKDRQIFELTDVPDGYLAIGSALGQRSPRHLVVAPAAADGIVNAIVELGSFGEMDIATVELLSQLSETIGIAIRSAHYRSHLQNLLEETQKQSEELQTQAEELRVSNEELDEQSRALKESQQRLEQQQAELEQTNLQLEEQAQSLEVQRDQMTQAAAKLQLQARELEQASRYKSDFLANMSHELRTPLNSSLILAKLLADNPTGNLTDEQVQYAETIRSAGNDLLTLINDILDLSKIEAGRMEVRPEPVGVRTLVESLSRIVDPIARQKGLILRTEIARDCPETLETDSVRLEQVLKNLLSNAMKFTEQGSVNLSVQVRPDHQIAFAVTDTGIGIPSHQQDLVFEAFRQADGTTNRKYGGTGLGLSISRELVRLLGGQLDLVSEPGQGSTFTVTLPTTYDPSRVRPSQPAASPAPRSVTPPQASVDGVPPAPAAPPHRAPASPAPRRSRIPDDRERLTGDSRVILVVEDDEPFARILVDTVHELDFQCLVATTAEEGLALARQFVPSAVVLDIGLPDHSGLTVLDRLKQDTRTRHVPVHVVSAQESAETALALGAVGYMLKPVDREELMNALRRMESRFARRMRRVLVVEDDAVQRDSIQRLLGTHDVETVGASSAADCLQRLREETFDCMVLDLSLPDASGYSLLETLSHEDAYSFPPVIVYTGRELSADDEQHLRRYSKSIIIKGAKSPERLLDEVTLFLHQVVSELPAEHQRMLEKARRRDALLEGRRIMIVEDDVRNVFALTSILEPRGLSVRIARNGREALNQLDAIGGDPNQKIDIILMDVMMPEMDGLTATREIRKRPDGRMPIIMLTAKAMRDDQENCIAAGANDYLAKPLDVEKLLSLIRVWMPR